VTAPTCCVCGAPGDLRPYGPGGAPICFPCGTAPERVNATAAVFTSQLEAACDADPAGIPLLTDDGPIPLAAADPERAVTILYTGDGKPIADGRGKA
jgi:hypothetical protein